MGGYNQSLLVILSCWDEVSLGKKEMPAVSRTGLFSRLSWKVVSVELGLSLPTVPLFFLGWGFLRRLCVSWNTCLLR